MSRSMVGFSLLVAGLCGCMDSLEKQVQKSPDSIIGKTTQDVGEFKPEAGLPVSDSKVRVTNPVTGPLEAYGPALEQIMKSHVAHALNLFQAEHGRFPSDYNEFMEKIIKANNIKLPVLPGGKKYQYDATEHKLVVVEAGGTPTE